MKIKLIFALSAVLLLTPVSALACACCSETGFYFSGPVNFGEHYRGEFERIRFGKTASLYLSEAGIGEDSQGIERPQETYALTGSFVKDVLQLSFRSGADRGVLELKLPEKMWKHSADIHDRKLSAGGGPLLYKEWRLEGDVSATGVFKTKSFALAKYTLVLQGRGNGCDNAEDYSNWRVDVRGKDVGFAFYGRLVRSGRSQ